MSSETEGASTALDYVQDDAVAAFMLQQTKEALQSQLSTSMALNTRTTQAVTLQLAAAAASATLAAAKGGSAPGVWFAAFAALAFLVGALIGFQGIRSDLYHLPGSRPEFWDAAKDYPDLQLRHVQSWVFGSLTRKIALNSAADGKTAKALNSSLRYGLVGGLLVALGVLTRL